MGQQSVNIRGIGLMNSGGADGSDARLPRRGYRERAARSIERRAGFRKRCRQGLVGYVPRLGKAGRDNQDDIVAAIVVMNRTLHTNDVLPRVRAEIEKMNSRRQSAAGREIGSVL